MANGTFTLGLVVAHFGKDGAIRRMQVAEVARNGNFKLSPLGEPTKKLPQRWYETGAPGVAARLSKTPGKDSVRPLTSGVELLLTEQARVAACEELRQRVLAQVLAVDPRHPGAEYRLNGALVAILP